MKMAESFGMTQTLTFEESIKLDVVHKYNAKT